MICRPAHLLRRGATLAVALAWASHASASPRLDSYLKDHPQGAVYPPGVAWQSSDAASAQYDLRQRLLTQTVFNPRITADPADRSALEHLIESFRATGRLPLASANPYFLEGRPAINPVLGPGSTVTVPAWRPADVGVIDPHGQLCLVPHVPGLTALAYAQSCQAHAADQVDTLWLIQPDGVVRQYDVAPWNTQAQDEPAPGAYVWAPPRDGGWPAWWSAEFAALLAAQGSLADQVHHQPGTLAWAGLPRRATATLTPATAVSTQRPLMVSANDWGLTGVLQTPSARLAGTGEARASWSHVFPYGRLNVFLQPFDWLEAGFRYTTVNNRLYGAASLSGTQSYKDKSADIKIRVLEETAFLPALAVGITDVAGTGLFSSEYVVGSKRWGNWDFSGGLAWGYLAGRQDLPNPLSLLSSSFSTRPEPSANIPTGGQFNIRTFFHGRTAPFAGVQYQFAKPQWLFKAELDPNNYQNEPQQNRQPVRSPFNLGLVYRPWAGMDVSAGLERGNTLMLNVVFHTDASHFDMPKLFDAAPLPVALEAAPAPTGNWAQTAHDIETQTHWQVEDIVLGAHDLQVVVHGPYGAYLEQRVERALAVLHRDAPPSIDRFILSFQQNGLPLVDRVVLRATYVARAAQPGPIPPRYGQDSSAAPLPDRNGSVVYGPHRTPLVASIEPSYSQTLGGPNGFVLYQAGVGAPFTARASETDWVTGNLNLRVVDNYANFSYDGPSLLPRVRTHIREYLTTSRLTMPTLQASHVGTLGPDQFYSVYAGYLESMFAGAGAEWLYRPWGSPVAVGANLNAVRQRAYDQHFGVTAYHALTGHGTLDWDTGWQGTHVKLSVGQYLAGDKGLTVDLSRRFDNGVVMGAYATKTNVSAAQFGEGSFDKALYLRVPFDAFLLSSSNSQATVLWQPLLRDGGAMLNRAVQLFDLTDARAPHAFRTRSGQSAAPWSGYPDAPDNERHFLGDLSSAGQGLARTAVSASGWQALVAGASLTLLSASLDKPVANWAFKHQGGKWDKLGKAAQETPYALVVGTGLLLTHVGPDDAAHTASSAVVAALYTIGLEEAARFAADRSRPQAGPSPFTFGGPSAHAAQSGFPSLHAGGSFALVTPFAQQYDAPWLYGVAALAGLGRIEQRQHYVSDVVAGSLIGYAVGSITLYSNQHGGPHLALTGGRGVQASWQF